jgi:hypothetical protein
VTRIALACGVVLAAAQPAYAGPPYVTDDPEPTDLGRWEIYGFANGSHLGGDTAGETGLDLNYGAAEDLQLTVVVPAAYDGAGAGMGVVELAAKYKLLHEQEGSWRPSVAIFPRAFAPTAKARFASTRANLLLPVWIGKTIGDWSMFGGGGYQLNPGAGNRDFWTTGLALTRSLGDRLSLGGEVYHHTRDADDAAAFTGVNLGLTYRVAEHWSLLGAGGPGVQNAGREGRFAFYVALQAVY